MALEDDLRRGFEEMLAEENEKKKRRRRGVEGDFGPGAMEAAAQPMGDQPAAQPAAQPAEPAAERRGARPRQAAAARPAVPLITPDVQAGVMQDAINSTTKAISDENKSRVSQLREMRRMQHEKELEMIRAQAALERVRQARMAEQYSMPGGVFDGGRLIDTTGSAVRVG